MSKTHLHTPRSLALSGLAVLALAAPASGAIIVSSFSNIAPSGAAPGDPHDPSTSGGPDLLIASSTDLAQGLPATVTYTTNGSPSDAGSTTREDSAGSSVWTDGAINTVYNGVGVGDAVAHATYGTVVATVGANNTDAFVTYDLGGTFSLASIDVFLGWNDSGRDNSSFNALVSTDGITFAPIAAYAKGPDDTGTFTTPVTNLHRVIDDGGAPIAEGVQYVQLQFTDADNGFVGMLEVDIHAVPEPSALLLSGLAGLAFLSCRRR